ncbi:MAG TPA: hypothetical protein PKL78_11415 [Anaerolineales bacterium]|nr:hypothetical protein [Anaerolineales bacterium]HNN14159.1 hypothetical protein [Anaerolineales bacterium]
MEFDKIFKSVEEAVYEVMVWLLLLPKTFIRTMTHPIDAMDYINAEWEKNPDDRFDEYLSPVLLWLLSAVIPITFFVSIASGAEDVSKKFTDLIYPITFYMMVIPFVYIAWMEWLNKEPVRRSTLKVSFYRHCYALAPAQLLTILSLGAVFIHWIFILLPALILPAYEAVVFKAELEVSYFKAFLYACIPQIAVLIFIVVVILTLPTLPAP